MTTRKPSISAKAYAHTAGVLYLINIACGMFGEIFVRGKLFVPGDAAATAHHILASQSLFRWGIAGDLVMHITDVPMAVIFYVLLRPVSRDLSLVAALFGMLQTAVLCANKLNLVIVLLLLGGSSSLQAFTAQLQALVSLSLTLHESGFGMGLIFFGVSCLVTGYLMLRSAYFPRMLGVLQALAGACYLVNSFAQILRPSLADTMFSYILAPAFVGEFGTCLWLLIMGLNQTKWNERIQMGPIMEGPADF